MSLGMYGGAVPSASAREDLRVLTRWLLKAAEVKSRDVVYDVVV
ncbi:hypothetical protein FIV07_06590 [Mycobacterium sp. THAF192]|nr:hypothetical protein FIV07_06590 [Mycobacterium sp. THAF192]